MSSADQLDVRHLSVRGTLTLSVAVSAMNTLLSGTPRSCAAICRVKPQCLALLD